LSQTAQQGGSVQESAKNINQKMIEWKKHN